MEQQPAVSVRVGVCGRVRCEPGWHLDAGWSQRLSDYDLWAVWAGRGSMLVNGEEVALKPGVCVCMRPGGTYLAQQDERRRLGVTYIHFSLADGVASGDADRCLPTEVMHWSDMAAMEPVLSWIVAMAHAGQSQVADLAMSAVVTELCQRRERWSLRPTAAVIPDWLATAAERLTGPGGEAWPVEALAEAAGYTADHFTRRFKATYGCSPQRYRVEARLARAKQMLTESSLSVSRISELLGYRDVFFFSRQFRAHVGRSPTEYRGGEA